MKKKTLTAEEPVVVRNIDELAKGIPKTGKVLIHFTKTQWKHVTEGLKRGRTLPKRGVVFAYTPLPDDTGGIGYPECIPGPCELCSIRPRLFPDGTIGMQCLCRRDPNCEPPPPPPGPVGSCRFVFRRQGLYWRLVCESVNCTGNCRIAIVPRSPGWLITCACQ